MRRISGLILLSVVAAAANPCLAQVWCYQRSGSIVILRGVSFSDSLNGMAVGDSGTMLVTHDGADTWRTLPRPTTAALHAVNVFDALIAVVAGDGGIILRTSDGGISWERRPSGTAARLRALTFSDESNGTAVGDSGTIVRSTDGGLSWIKQVSGTVQTLNGVSCPTPSAGTVVGDNGAILHTTNGGINWYSQPVGSHGSLSAVCFLDSSTGMAIMAGGYVLHTTNAGAGWFLKQDPPSSPALHAIAFSDENVGIVAGDGGKIFRTEDGGWTWAAEAANVSRDWFAATLAGPAVATIVGDSGAILHTSTGGGTAVVFPVNLSSPPDGAAEQLVEKPISWLGAPFASSYIVQVATDSMFEHGIAFNDSSIVDTFAYVDSLRFGTEHFWRVKATTPLGANAWSETWNFVTSNYPVVTVSQIQERPPDSLLLADSLQNSASRWTLQASPYLRVPVRLRAECVVPPGVISLGVPAMVLHDTGIATAWGGFPVILDTSIRPGDFLKARQGDVMELRGIVDEIPPGSMNSTTILRCLFAAIVGSSSILPQTAPVPVQDFRQGMYPAGRINYSGGEPYEGSVVELHGLTVSSIVDTSLGTVVLADGEFNAIVTSDLSRWFTLAPHRDPASDYSTPPLGAHIDTLRGILTTVNSRGEPAIGGGYRIAPLYPGDLIYGAQSRGAVRGSVYADINNDSTRNTGEPGIPSVQISISGKLSATALTDSNGNFSISGLDSGIYRVSASALVSMWETEPVAGYRTITLGINDTVSGLRFGYFAPWNTISGTIYDDRNENGVLDSGDAPLSGWMVKQTGNIDELVTSDTNGFYLLSAVSYGTTTVTLRVESGWEQIFPQLQQAYSFEFQALNQHYTQANFALHRIPRRVKLTIRVHDNTAFGRREIWCGVRPGAAYGIWGIDTACTNADFSEGEFELPPVLWGMFDARFKDPRRSSAKFGNGSWTDMRPYRSPGQIDTFLVRFSPGIAYGGDYPMTLEWSREEVQTYYSGSVSLTDQSGVSINMKNADSAVVTDPSIGALTLIAGGPILPALDVPAEPAELPAAYSLAQNYPNPFNPSTVISYTLPARVHVQLIVYNILGEEVRRLVDREQPPGKWSVTFDASSAAGGLASGVYLYRLQAGNYSSVKKMLLLR